MDSNYFNLISECREVAKEKKVDENKSCPKCRHRMSYGAPHGGSVGQWECHNCGYIEPGPLESKTDLDKSGEGIESKLRKTAESKTSTEADPEKRYQNLVEECRQVAKEKVVERKVSEQDEFEKEDSTKPSDKEEETPTDTPPSPEEIKEPETKQLEARKEYLGKSDDTHYYFVTTEGTGGETGDLLIVDQDGVKKYSAKEHNLDVSEESIADFIIQAVPDIKIDQVEFSIIMKYIYPKLEKESPKEEVVEEPEKEKKPEEIKPEEKPEKGEPTKIPPEGPVESKKMDEQEEESEVTYHVSFDIRGTVEDRDNMKQHLVDLKDEFDISNPRVERKPVESRKVDEQSTGDIERTKKLIAIEIASDLLGKPFGELSEEEQNRIRKMVNRAVEDVAAEIKVGEGKNPKAGDNEKTQIKKLSEGLEKLADEVLDKAGFVKGKDYEWDFGQLTVLTANTDRIISMVDALDASPHFRNVRYGQRKIYFGEVKSGEWLAAESKVSEDIKVKKLIEMKVTDDEGNTFDVRLVDDGTLDTVISINEREFKFDSEFTSYWRDKDGTLTDEGLKELALDALANIEPEEYDELVVKGKKEQDEYEEVYAEQVEKDIEKRHPKPLGGEEDKESDNVTEATFDYIHKTPGMYKVAFYDGHVEKIEGESKVDAKTKAEKIYPKSRVANVEMLQATGKEEDIIVRPNESNLDQLVARRDELKAKEDAGTLTSDMKLELLDLEKKIKELGGVIESKNDKGKKGDINMVETNDQNKKQTTLESIRADITNWVNSVAEKKDLVDLWSRLPEVEVKPGQVEKVEEAKPEGEDAEAVAKKSASHHAKQDKTYTAKVDQTKQLGDPKEDADKVTKQSASHHAKQDKTHSFSDPQLKQVKAENESVGKKRARTEKLKEWNDDEVEDFEDLEDAIDILLEYSGDYYAREGGTGGEYKEVVGSVLKRMKDQFGADKVARSLKKAIVNTEGIAIDEIKFWAKTLGVKTGALVESEESSSDPDIFVEDNPDPKLVKLLKQGADGGEGEFEPFFPDELIPFVEKYDISYAPVLRDDGKVEWVRVGHRYEYEKESKVEEKKLTEGFDEYLKNMAMKSFRSRIGRIAKRSEVSKDDILNDLIDAFVETGGENIDSLGEWISENLEDMEGELEESVNVEEKLFTKQFKDLAVGADFMHGGKRCVKYSETEYKSGDKVSKISPETDVEAIEKPRRESKENTNEATEGTKIDVYTSADDKTPQKATIVSYQRPGEDGETTAKLVSGKTVKMIHDDRSGKWIVREDVEVAEEDEELDILNDEVQNLMDEMIDADDNLDEAKKKKLVGKKGRPLKKGAAVRSRGDCVFPHTSPKVTDNKDHFPINSENQARNALARANQYKSAPKWYKGSLESLVKNVARRVKSKYPDIKVSKAAETPGKGPKERIFVDREVEDISERKGLERLNQLLGI